MYRAIKIAYVLNFLSFPDGKEHDVLVCYAADDTDFAVGVLATTLETRYNYTVTLCQLNNARGQLYNRLSLG